MHSWQKMSWLLQCMVYACFINSCGIVWLHWPLSCLQTAPCGLLPVLQGVDASCERHTLPCLQDVQAAAAAACLEVARHERGFWDMANDPAEET